MNESVSSVTVKALQSDNSDAKTVNLQVINANIITDPEIPPPISIYDLAEEDPIILMAYAGLRNKGDRITVKNITFELKGLYDDKNITKHAYQTALRELKKVKDRG